MMNICDLFIFPSLHETGPQVVLEAKQCQAVCLVSPQEEGEGNKKWEDGIIIKDLNVNVWSSIVFKFIKKKNKFHKKKLKNDNKQKSWKDIYFLKFDSIWKELLKSLMKNVLLIAPHPDDEIVGAHTIIKRIFNKKK